MSDDEDNQEIMNDDSSDNDSLEKGINNQYNNFAMKINNENQKNKKQNNDQHVQKKARFQEIKQQFELEEQSQSSAHNIHISEPLKKLDRYVQFHKISIQDFWKSNKIYSEPEEFEDFINEIGFNCRQNDLKLIINDLVNEEGQVTIEALCKKVSTWNNNENAMIEFIKEKALKMAQDSKKKVQGQIKYQKSQTIGQQAASQRPASCNNARPISGISQKTHKTKLTDLTEIKQHKPIINKSNQYIQKTKEKEKEQEKLLQLTISKGKNEYEYEMLIKMGEANELNQMLESKITYRAYKGAQGNLKVHVYELDKFVRDMNLEEFQREYNTIKNKYNETRNLKIWEVLSENKKNSKSGSHFQKGSSQQDEKGQQSRQINKQERQAELKRVLLETMMLTNILKEQLQVLNKKGINQQIQSEK